MCIGRRSWYLSWLLAEKVGCRVRRQVQSSELSTGPATTYDRGTAAAHVWPTIVVFLPQRAGSSTEDLPNINHCMYRSVSKLFVTRVDVLGKHVGRRSNFDPSRPLYTQDTSFSVKSSLTVVCQGVQTLSTDIFARRCSNCKKRCPIS